MESVSQTNPNVPQNALKCHTCLLYLFFFFLAQTVYYTPGQHLPTSCMLLCVFQMRSFGIRHDLSTLICLKIK